MPEMPEMISSCQCRLSKVGWIFAQSTAERDFIMSGEEICQMAAMQEELGDRCVTAVVAAFPGEEVGDAPEVHFEAFQVSSELHWFPFFLRFRFRSVLLFSCIVS